MLRVVNRLWLIGRCHVSTQRFTGWFPQMSSYVTPEASPAPYVDPTKTPASVPAVQELGATSAPLKSAAFFIGAYCKEYNGGVTHVLGAPRPLADTVHCLERVQRGFYALQG